MFKYFILFYFYVCTVCSKTSLFSNGNKKVFAYKKFIFVLSYDIKGFFPLSLKKEICLGTVKNNSLVVDFPMLPYESTNHVLRVLGLHTTFYMGEIENEVVKFVKQLQLNAVCE